MQRKLRGLNSALSALMLLSLLATTTVADSNSSSGKTQLRWISPSKTSTPDDYREKSPKSSKSVKSSTEKRIIQTWRSPADKSEQPAESTSQSGPKSNQSKPNPKTEKAKKQATTTKPTKESSKSTSSTKSPNGNWIVVDDVDPNVKPKKDRPSKDEDPRVAGRIFGRRVEEAPQQRSSVPWMETMHPTEKQVDDRRRGTEPPVDELPAPSREIDESEDTAATPALKPLTNSQKRMRSKIRRVLAWYYNRPLNTRDRSPWEIMHGIISYEVHSKVLRGGPNGEPVTAVGWLCFNQPCKKRTLMYVNDEGELRVRVGPALQGHRGQLLAMLAWSNVSRDYPMRVEGHDLTVNDLIEMEKRTCYPRSELTFKLIGLMHYLPSDAKWTNEQGMEWNLPKLVYDESRQSLRDAACGGTHRLTGLTLAYKTREKRGEPVDGAYIRAKQYVTKYKNYAYRLQNSDGSFSTEWFRGPGNEESLDRKLQTTGHILEWLLYAAEERDLRSSRIHRATNYLANTMYNNRTRDWDAGPLGHAIHALLLYDRLMFVPHDSEGVLPMATVSPSENRTSSRSQKSRSSSSRSSSGNYRQSSKSRTRR